ncbi:stonustoxin subunit alpha-like [Rhinophrynus dorsalis]
MNTKIGHDTIEIAALGRPFSIGMLYDCRKDKLIPGVTLWNMESLKKDLRIHPQENTSFEIITSDSISDKTTALKITASIKASVLCGLITVGGSAAYLHDTKKYKSQARVTLQYSRTTRFEELSMNHLGSHNITFNDMLDQGMATHVVVGILYGARAFFIFDQKVSSTEKIDDIQATLSSSITKIPTIPIEGESSLKRSSTEKGKFEKFSCKFYGDFVLSKNPSNYEEAIKVYNTLSTLLGEKEELAVPLKVWLYPLEKLNSKAAKMVQDISVHLLCEIENFMVEMSDVNMKSNELMKKPAALAFPVIQEKIKKFQRLSQEYMKTFQKRVSEMLPSIREGEKEAILVDFLARRTKSPFNIQLMNKFLLRKHEEIGIVNDYLIALEEVKVLSTESELNCLVLSPSSNYVMCLNFASVGWEEQYLNDLNNWLQKKSWEGEIYENKKDTPWYKDQSLQDKARFYLQAFKVFYKRNKLIPETTFAVSASGDQNNPGVSIYLYDKGKLVTTNFNPPSKPHPPLIISKNHDLMELKFDPATFGIEEIKRYQVEYKCNDEETWNKIKTEDNLQTFFVTGLLPHTIYSFRYAAVSVPGISEVSEPSCLVQTLPCSPPGIPYLDTFSPSYVTLKWKQPTVILKGVAISDYKVEYCRNTEKENILEQWIEQRCGRKTEKCKIEGLIAGAVYRFRVSAICEKNMESSEPSELTSIKIPVNSAKGKLLLPFCQVC